MTLVFGSTNNFKSTGLAIYTARSMNYHMEDLLRPEVGGYFVGGLFTDLLGLYVLLAYLEVGEVPF